MEAWLANLSKSTPHAASVKAWDSSDEIVLPKAQALYRFVDLCTRQLMHFHSTKARGSPLARQHAADLALMQFVSGHIPPMRVEPLRLLQHPGPHKAPPPGGKACIKSDCRFVGCKGNRLEYVVQAPLPGAQVGQGKLFLILHHHKTQDSLRSKPIKLELPEQMHSALAPQIHACLKDPEEPLFFPHPTKGGPMPPSSFSAWWPNIQLGMRAPWLPMVLTMRQYRHIYVMDCRGVAAQEREQGIHASLNQQVAATMMGNSTDAWDHFYDREREDRETSAVVRWCSIRRQQLLDG
jgi:hypothetical protein